MTDSMVFNYICVFLTLIFCCWSGTLATIVHDDDMPFGSVGRIILLVNSFVLGIVCAVLLILKVREALGG